MPSNNLAVPDADEKGENAHLEQAPEDFKIQQDQAIRAEDFEHKIDLWLSIKTYRKAVLWSMAFSLCIICDGYDTGLLSSLAGLPPFREKYGHKAGTGYQLTAGWQTAITEAAYIGNVFGIFVSSWFQDRFGYRRTIQIFVVWMTAALFMVFFAPNVQVFFVGELLCGLPWGAFSSSAVSYASEVTPISLRGYLTTYVNLCWVIGQFIASGVLVGVSSRTDQWAYKLPFAVQWVWPVPIFILVTLAPESPWYYVRKGRYEDAERSVIRLAHAGDHVQPADTVAMMVRTNQAELENEAGTSYLECFKGVNLRRTEIACMAWMAQILSGSSFANSPTYFLQQAGLSTTYSFDIGLAAKALAFVGTCGSWVTLTYYGRRPVFVGGLAVLTLILLLVGAVSFAPKSDTAAKWGIAGLTLVWVFTYDFTIGPVTYAIVGETSSTRLRSKTVGLARNAYNVIHIIAGLLYTYQVNNTAWDWGAKAGWFWGGSALIALIWAYFRLPEMKHRSFRELEILFERRIPAREFKNTQVDLQAEH